MPPLSNRKDTAEEPSSLHDSKHSKHTHATRVQNTTLYSDDTTHSKQHRNKGIQPMAPPARTITVALDMSKAFDTINIHPLIRKLLQTEIPGTIIKFIANYIKGRKAYTTHPHVNSKLPFHKLASFYQRYSTFTLQTNHHPVHRFRLWATQIPSPSHLHTQARVKQEIHTTIPT